MQIPFHIIFNSIKHKVDTVNWYVHCGDHIMARRPTDDKYITLFSFNGYDLDTVKYYTKIVEIHNGNLLVGMTDTHYNKSL